MWKYKLLHFFIKYPIKISFFLLFILLSISTTFIITQYVSLNSIIGELFIYNNYVTFLLVSLVYLIIYLFLISIFYKKIEEFSCFVSDMLFILFNFRFYEIDEKNKYNKKIRDKLSKSINKKQYGEISPYRMKLIKNIKNGKI